jgi:hypothetical protein
MKSKSTNLFTQNKNLFFIALAVAFILLLPWLAMQFSGEMAWSPFDFAFAGTFLFGIGLAFELLTRKVGDISYRLGVGAALAGVLLLVWLNLAVGIIGSEDNPINILYFGVLTVILIGSLLARFQPQGLARALFATALAQALVTLVALFAEGTQDAFKIVMLNGFFVALWAASALLFRGSNTSSNRRLE